MRYKAEISKQREREMRYKAEISKQREREMRYKAELNGGQKIYPYNPHCHILQKQ